ncbi:MAG TPA: cytochrome c [Gaiellaceae bacterium]|nr:cytochrome c [Gaiellaceae bacterium]
MAYRPPPKRRWNYVTAEAALVLTVLFLAFVAGIAGFAVGRATAEDDNNTPAAAETTTEGTTSEATTSEATTTAETQTEETSGETNAAGGEPEGEAIFNSAGCAACHTFAPAGSSGTVGPNLDNVNVTVAQVEQQVRNGGGGMPPFKDRLSDAEITEVSRFVANG